MNILQLKPIYFSGVFQPPANGVYLLTFYGLLAGTDGGDVYIKQDDNVLCQGWFEENDTSTCTAIAELTTDDSVRVTGNSDNPSTLRNIVSGFAGYLIYDSCWLVRVSLFIELGCPRDLGTGPWHFYDK